MKKLLISYLSLISPLFATDDDRASRDNADNAKDAHDNGSGRGVDYGCSDWGSKDRDNNLPNNDTTANEGLHTPSWDRRD